MQVTSIGTAEKEIIVSEHPNLALIHAYNDAWTRRDMATAACYVAEDVAFDGPIQHLRTREAFIAAVGRFAAQVTGPMQIISEFADDEQVLMLYDILTAAFGVVRSCDLFTIKDGLIQTNILLFDTAPFRQAQPAQ